MRRLITPPPRRVLRGQAGQTAVEYIGMLLIAATVVGLVAASGVAAQVRAAIDTAICIVSTAEQADCARSADAVAGDTPRAPDADGDGLSDRRERQLGTLPGKADSDTDGIVDADELRRGTDPTEPDSDGDGITDGDEIRLTGQTGDTFDPTKRDTDDDGLSDSEERAAGTPPDSADDDRDGHGGRTDGLTDAEEILRHHTDPTKIDTDGDGESDGDEVNAGSNPLADERALGQKIKPLLEDLALGDLPTPAAVGTLLKKLPGLTKHLRRLLGSSNDAAKALRKNVSDAVRRRNKILHARRKNTAANTAAGAAKRVPQALRPLANNPLSLQKQAGHIRGTPQHLQRLRAGKPTSTFFRGDQAEELTRRAWSNGIAVPGRSGVRDFDFGFAVGRGPRGGLQTRVRVHIDRQGRIHGHPVGRESVP